MDIEFSPATFLQWVDRWEEVGKGGERAGVGVLGVVVCWGEVPTTTWECMDEGVHMSDRPTSALCARDTNPTGFSKQRIPLPWRLMLGDIFITG